MTEFTNAYSGFIPEMWSLKLNSLLLEKCPMLQCVNRNWEGEIAQAGDKVHILTAPEISVSTLSNDAISYPEIAPKRATLTVDQKKFFAFKVNDIALVQGNENFVESYMENAKKSIEISQDNYLLGLHTEVKEENTIGENATPVRLSAENIYSQFVDLAAVLKKSNATVSGQTPWVVINPDIEAVLLKTPQFTSASNLGSETLRTGAIGKIAGMDVLVSNNLTAVEGAINVLAGTNDAITFASKVITMESMRDLDSFSDIIRGLYAYGACVVNDAAIAKLICSLDA